MHEKLFQKSLKNNPYFDRKTSKNQFLIFYKYTTSTIFIYLCQNRSIDTFMVKKLLSIKNEVGLPWFEFEDKKL